MLRVASFLIVVLSSLIEWVLIDIPGPIGRRLRRAYWRTRLKHMGRDVQIDIGVRILNPYNVSIGDNTWIDSYVHIIAGAPFEGEGPILHRDNPEFEHGLGDVTIGSNVHIANYVVLQGHGGLSIGDNIGVASGSMIYSMSHHHSNLLDRSDPKKYKFTPMVNRRQQSLICAAVVLGRDSAVGLNCTILPGVSVGAGSWIGSGSVVTRSVPSNVLASGNPAEVVKPELHPGWKVDTDEFDD